MQPQQGWEGVYWACFIACLMWLRVGSEHLFDSIYPESVLIQSWTEGTLTSDSKDSQSSHLTPCKVSRACVAYVKLCKTT